MTRGHLVTKVPACESSVAVAALSPDATRIATASEKGALTCEKNDEMKTYAYFRKTLTIVGSLQIILFVSSSKTF